jgi:hypothetical protein
MDRRRFIEGGVALAALAAAEIGVAGSVGSSGTGFLGRPNASRFALGYHSGVRGGYWIDATSRPYEPAPPQVKLFLLGVQASTYPIGSNPLRRFEVNMLYQMAGNTTLPYRWATLTRNEGLVTSKAITHTVRPDQIAGVSIGFDYGDPVKGAAKRETETLPWISGGLPVLTPGFYALVGPGVGTGEPPSWSALAPPVTGGCLIGRCDGRPRDFDAILIAVERA